MAKKTWCPLCERSHGPHDKAHWDLVKKLGA